MDNKKNICIVNHYAITSDMTGSTRHYDFAIELIKRGYTMTIFSSSFRHQGKREESKLKKNEKWKIIKKVLRNIIRRTKVKNY